MKIKKNKYNKFKFKMSKISMIVKMKTYKIKKQYNKQYKNNNYN